MNPRRRPFAAVLLAAALFFLAQATWIPAKATLGQWLLERAWAARVAGAETPRPWPWADTTPIALLEVPRLGLRQLVLEGASGRNLAWGPTAMTSVRGRDVILSAHRDTHFAPLATLESGDELRLNDGERIRQFRVAWLDIVDSRYQELVTRADQDRLTLVTCYPFDAPDAGGPLRLVVTALPLEEAPQAQTPGKNRPPEHASDDTPNQRLAESGAVPLTSASQSATLSPTTR